eukprot:757583-Hanusia_phi.AAC.1
MGGGEARGKRRRKEGQITCGDENGKEQEDSESLNSFQSESILKGKLQPPPSPLSPVLPHTPFSSSSSSSPAPLITWTRSTRAWKRPLRVKRSTCRSSGSSSITSSQPCCCRHGPHRSQVCSSSRGPAGKELGTSCCHSAVCWATAPYHLTAFSSCYASSCSRPAHYPPTPGSEEVAPVWPALRLYRPLPHPGSSDQQHAMPEACFAPPAR